MGVSLGGMGTGMGVGIRHEAREMGCVGVELEEVG